MPVPPSTYRLQIRPSFGLRAAAQLCGYLRELGAGAVYLSPILASASGSEHGYDVVDFSRVDDARGGAAGWRALVDAAHGLQLVLDVVPNHSGIADAAENEPWWDVLRLGSGSPYARWFDIDWTRGRVLLPVLGDDFDAARDLSVAADELRHGSHRFPIAPGTTGGSAAQVHDRQHYELVSFRRDEQSYRRFFAVPTLAGLGDDRLRRARRGQRAVRRPVRRGGAERSVPVADGRSAVVRPARRGGQAAGGHDDPAPGSSPARRALRGDRAGGRGDYGTARRIPGLSLLSARGGVAPDRRGRDRRSAATHAGVCDRRAASAAGRPRRRPARALPADVRRGDGEGRRGHGLLPVHALRRAQRGRRRPVPVRVRTRRFPRGTGPAPARRAAGHDDAVDARHQAWRGRSRATGGARRGAR